MGTLKLITLWFPPLRFATLAALVLSFGTLGNMTAATPLVLMVQAMGWRMSFVVFSGINVLLALLFFAVVRDRPDTPGAGEPRPADSTDLREVLTNLRALMGEKDYWIISLGAFCRYGIFAAVQALWAAPYLMTVIGISPVATGNMLLLMGIGVIVGSPVCGWFSDSLFKTRKGVIMPGLIGMILVLAILACLPRGADLTVLSLSVFRFRVFHQRRTGHVCAHQGAGAHRTRRNGHDRGQFLYHGGSCRVSSGAGQPDAIPLPGRVAERSRLPGGVFLLRGLSGSDRRAVRLHR